MTKLNNKLYVDTGNNKMAIDLHDTVNDFYSKKGMPVQFRNGTIAYAAYVNFDDINRSIITTSDSEGEHYVGISSINEVQQLTSTKRIEINLKGNSEQEVIYDITSFVAPFTGKVHLFSQAHAQQDGWGYSGDSWQWARLYLDLDGNNINSFLIRRSQGLRWFTLYNGEIEVTGGSHILRFRIRGKCSSKDHHQTTCDGWKTEVTLVGIDV